MDEGLRAAARRLRVEEELSGAQIAQRLGVHPSTVADWVRDLPAPEWTRRPNAKDGLRAQAQELRRQGMSVPEIGKALGVARSTAFEWTKDLPRGGNDEEIARRKAHSKSMTDTRWAEFRATRDQEHTSALAAGVNWVSQLSDREVLLVGSVIYWCEGSKSKPWRRAWRIDFINSDIVLLRLFMRFLDLLKVDRALVTYRLSIHELADSEGAKRWWEVQLGLPVGAITGEWLKRHNPATVRNNVQDDYHGCLVVRVSQSRDLYWQIEGIIAGMAKVVEPPSTDRR